MKSKLFITLFLALGVLFLVQPAARADTMQLYFTGGTTGGLDPYQIILTPAGTTDPVNGAGAVTVWMNCDDHFDYIQSGEYWTATVFSGSATNLNLTSMSQRNGWGVAAANYAYDEKAWIELNYGASSNPAYSNALWHIFDPAFACDSACQAIINLAAAAATADAGNNYLTYRSHLTIYSGPYSNIHNPVSDGHGGYYDPQEFNTVPDGGMTLVLLGGALVGVATLRRKFRV